MSVKSRRNDIVRRQEKVIGKSRAGRMIPQMWVGKRIITKGGPGRRQVERNYPLMLTSSVS